MLLMDICEQVVSSETVAVKCMCATEKHMWCADTASNIYIYRYVSYMHAKIYQWENDFLPVTK